MARTLDRVINAVIFTSSVVESSIYTYSLPANTLGTNKTVRGKLNCTLRNSSGVNQTYTLRLKFGGATNLQDVTIAVPAAAAATDLRSVIIEFEITAANSTTGQLQVMRVEISSIFAGAGGISGDWGTAPLLAPTTMIGTSNITTTNAAVIDVTIQAAAATATQQLVRRSGILELV